MNTAATYYFADINPYCQVWGQWLQESHVEFFLGSRWSLWLPPIVQTCDKRPAGFKYEWLSVSVYSISASRLTQLG